MKKKLVLPLIALSVAALFTIGGCKKSTNNETDYSSDFTIQTDEQTFVSSEDDLASNDANAVVEEDTEFAGGRTGNPICGATITRSTTNTSKVLTIAYNGQNCNLGRLRTGEIILTMPKQNRWKDAGSQISLTYKNFKIVRTSDNKSIVLNGTKTITNVTGGEIRNIPLLRTITHTITSNAITITFSDSTRREWQIAKERVFTFNNGLIISTGGTYNNGTVSNISEWGINRLGKQFITQITEPLVIRQDCAFRLVSGKIQYSNMERPITITFGLNANGVATSCPATGSYFYKIEWTGILNGAHSIIRSY